jgi:Flp pilus assembly protein TadG
MRMHAAMRRLFGGETGGSLVELALVTPVLFLLLAGGVDFARAYYLGMEVSGAAQAGATYGCTNRTDTTGITAVAKAAAPDVASANLSVSPSWGCECSNATVGSTNSSASCSSTPSCSGNTVVYWEKVTASTTYSPVFPWPGVPSSMTFSQTAVMRALN